MTEPVETTTLARRADTSPVLLSSNLTAAEIIARKRLIQDVMDNVMEKDVHYGVIPGTQKPTLLLPGAECLASTFQLAIAYNFTKTDTGDAYSYDVKAIAQGPGGEFLGEGVGTCSTDEDKFRWRDVVISDEFDATPEDRRRRKWTKERDSGGHPITRMQVRTNPADLSNNVLKIAKKRAYIDVVRSVTAASDIFDVDLDDRPADDAGKGGGLRRPARPSSPPD
jgi:hypothetical protein